MEANPQFNNYSSTQLENSITRLCADINAATYQQLIMIAEFDRRNSWGYEGCRSCAHWLNWRCGISLSAGREKVRVGHALSRLPKTSEAFSSGILSYSKVRAITRVGTESNEECLLSYARYGTASQLDKTVRLYRQQYDEAGIPMVGYHNAIHDSDDTVCVTDDERRDAENQGAMHHHEYRHVSTHWDEHGCLEIRARLTPEQGALVIKAIEAAVESIAKTEPAETSESHALESTEDTSAGVFPINTIRQYPRQRADALVLMAETLLKGTKAASSTDDRYQIVVHVDSDVLSQNVLEKTSGEPDCYIDKQVAVPVETARRLSCSCKVVTALIRKGEPLNIGRSSRAIPTGIRRALGIRDGVCQFPGCDCQHHLDAHHIVHWANGGPTSLENLIEVCHHHHKLLHEGQFSVVRQADGTLMFRRPDGTLIQRAMAHTGEPVPLTHKHPWSARGDEMDYAMALYNLAYANREQHRNSVQT